MCREIPLTRGFVALVDQEDYERVSQHNWHIQSGGYAASSIGGGYKVLMSRFIMGLESGDSRQIDHKNGNRLDNRRENLRICNRSQNGANRSHAKKLGYHGISWKSGKWEAAIQVNGKYRYLGRFTDETDAARAYDTAALEYFGEFAALNFPHGKSHDLS